MYYLSLLLLLQTILSCHCQVSFTITRSESGDEVASSLTSVDYCIAIHGYLNGSQCKCDFGYTFSLEHQMCIDYYTGKNRHRFYFSPGIGIAIYGKNNSRNSYIERYGLGFCTDRLSRSLTAIVIYSVGPVRSI